MINVTEPRHEKGETMKKLSVILTLTLICSVNLSAISYSLEFDGINDYVDCGNDPSLTEFNELTIEVWVWLQNSYPDQKIVNKLQGWATNYYIFGVGSGTFYCEIVAGGHTLYFSTGTVPSQQWTHLALTFLKGNGGNNGAFYGYINGEIVFSYDYVVDAAISAGNPAYPFRIGCASWDNNYFHVDGIIDEVRIWNIERTSLEIRNFKDTRLDGTEPGLVAYYPMNAGSGTVLGDYSSNSNTGTLLDGGIVGHGPVWTYDSFRPAGDGSIENPFLVNGLRHLVWMDLEEDYWGSNYEQTANIDASPTIAWNDSSGFTPIGDFYDSFTGNYDGNDFIIDGLYINRSSASYIGLFAQTEGDISNLGLTNVDITGHNQVGGLVAITEGNIESCYVTRSVNGDFDVGGLAGIASNSTVDCYASCDVYGSQWVGGLMGSCNGSISNCYSTGTVTGSYYVAGLVGKMTIDVIVYVTNSYSLCYVHGYNSACGLLGGFSYNTYATNCYAAGPLYGPLGSTHGLGFNMSDVNCFWDTELSGCSTSDSGTGKTTAEMKDLATFTNLETVGLQSPCWDFVNNPYDDTGSEDIWNMNACINDGYPHFSRQDTTPAPPAPENIVITIVGNDVQLVWDDTGSSIFYIYRSQDPYQEYWERIGSSETNSYINTDAGLESAYYYYVTVCDQEGDSTSQERSDGGVESETMLIFCLNSIELKLMKSSRFVTQTILFEKVTQSS